jgi:DNA polymerase III sliding clamp (beta) subunit (PCNA family)
MLKELRFVQGAVAKKDFLPAMTHFAIEGGTVRAYNGTLALCAPIAFNIDCKPKAAPLVHAIRNCSDSEPPALSMTANGRLSIKSGKFRAFIDCVKEETPHVLPDGERVEFDGEAMLAALKTIYPFIGDDASRPWCNGVLLRDQSAFATNNVTLVEYWVGMQMPTVVNVPRVAVNEMLRINEAPTHAQVTTNSMTFHYSDGRWIRTQLLDVQWPDVYKILDADAAPLPIDPQIFDGLETIKPFTDKMGRVFIKNGVLSTHTEPTEGASYTLDGDHTFEGIYSLEILKLLNGIALTIDWTSYPRPCMFYGERLRGALVGMRA